MTNEINIEEYIKNKLRVLKPSKVIIEDESVYHKNHYENKSLFPSHLVIKVVSDQFEGKSLVERHRAVNKLMNEDFNKGLHALKIITKTSREYQNEKS